MLKKYAHLLVNYCVEIKKGDRLYIRSTTLAEPLVREVYREALKAGALVEMELDFREQGRILLNEGNEEQLQYVSPLYKRAMETFEAFLMIRAPFNLREDQNVDAAQAKIRRDAHKGVLKSYFERTGTPTRDLKRNTCQYPTLAGAQNAGMSLEEYENFIFNACKLNDPDPIQSWRNVSKSQQKIVDYLNSKENIRYLGKNVDITFNTKGRIWMNSDGQTNMPSGEVYTSPVEDSVNGKIHFSFPAMHMGHEIEGATLWVKDGYVEKWEASRGQDFLDSLFQLEGARRFGEAAIGTNYDINRFTKNILFDEKIGGTIHMAIGQSYLQTGGKNQSSIHVDMITDMTEEGEIYADGEKFYQNGKFLL